MLLNNPWRDKYLAALAEQEKLEQQVAAHADMLRRTVVHLSAASDGLNATLDAELDLLKEKLRGAAGLAVHEQMLRVEYAVKEWHYERANHTRATCDTLKALTQQFKTLRLDSHTQDDINAFNRSISPNTYTLYQQAQWLQQLLQLQQKVLQVAAAPDQNLWQRLNNRTRLLSTGSMATATKHAANNPNNNSIADAPSATPAAQTANLAAKQTSSHHEAPLSINLAAGGELEALLHEIFSAIVPTEELASQIIAERQKIDLGVTSVNIAEFLRAIRDILQTSYMNYGAEFSRYLIHIDAELARICQTLEHHIEDTARQINQRARQTQRLEKSHQQLSHSQQNATTLNELKFAVMEHLAVIQKNLSEREQDQTDIQANAQTLTQVTEQLQQVEIEAKSTKTLVEKEQHQANRDALTALPNRSACSQRLEQECDRFQRYGHPVTVAVCNIDGLGKFNKFGYIIGDRILKLVATTLRERLRTVDFVGRLNGDKFLIILPETDVAQGKPSLNKIGQFIAKTPLNIKGKPVIVTLSFSVTALIKNEDSADCTSRLMRALVELHAQGGNQCAVF